VEAVGQVTGPQPRCGVCRLRIALTGRPGWAHLRTPAGIAADDAHLATPAADGEHVTSCRSCGHTGDCGCSCCTAGPGWRAPSQPLRDWRECENGARVATCYHLPRCGPMRAGQQPGTQPFGRWVVPGPAPAVDRLAAAVVAEYSRVMADWGYATPPPVTVADARRVLAGVAGRQP
jgi:hypothetical protein